jgi:hypothetical protein
MMSNKEELMKQCYALRRQVNRTWQGDVIGRARGDLLDAAITLLRQHQAEIENLNQRIQSVHTEATQRKTKRNQRRIEQQTQEQTQKSLYESLFLHSCVHRFVLDRETLFLDCNGAFMTSSVLAGWRREDICNVTQYVPNLRDGSVFSLFFQLCLDAAANGAVIDMYTFCVIGDNPHGYLRQLWFSGLKTVASDGQIKVIYDVYSTYFGAVPITHPCVPPSIQAHLASMHRTPFDGRISFGFTEADCVYPLSSLLTSSPSDDDLQSLPTPLGDLDPPLQHDTTQSPPSSSFSASLSTSPSEAVSPNSQCAHPPFYEPEPALTTSSGYGYPSFQLPPYYS